VSSLELDAVHDEDPGSSSLASVELEFERSLSELPSSLELELRSAPLLELLLPGHAISASGVLGLFSSCQSELELSGGGFG
jgi:hypothetical protein